MGDGGLLVLLLLVVMLLLWMLVWGPKAKAARGEKERLTAEARALREAELARLKSEREDLLKSIRLRAPDFIIKARLDFEREYRASSGDGVFGQEMSPLVCFGYRVGKTNGRIEMERQAILEYAVAADYDATLPFLPVSYRNDWGIPLSVTRFNRIYQHLNSMADLRDGRRTFEEVVSHWHANSPWLIVPRHPRRSPCQRVRLYRVLIQTAQKAFETQQSQPQGVLG